MITTTPAEGEDFIDIDREVKAMNVTIIIDLLLTVDELVVHKDKGRLMKSKNKRTTVLVANYQTLNTLKLP